MAEGLKLNEMWENARGGYNRGVRGYNKMGGWMAAEANRIGPMTPGIRKAFNSMPTAQVERFMSSKMGPNVATVGLGIGALGQLGNMRQRLRYHDYGGAALSGGMAAAMGYGAFLMGFQKNAMSRHLKDAAMMASKHSYGIRGAARAVGQMMKI